MLEKGLFDNNILELNIPIYIDPINIKLTN